MPNTISDMRQNQLLHSLALREKINATGQQFKGGIVLLCCFKQCYCCGGIVFSLVTVFIKSLRQM